MANETERAQQLKHCDVRGRGRRRRVATSGEHCQHQWHRVEYQLMTFHVVCIQTAQYSTGAETIFLFFSFPHTLLPLHPFLSPFPIALSLRFPSPSFRSIGPYLIPFLPFLSSFPSALPSPISSPLPFPSLRSRHLKSSSGSWEAPTSNSVHFSFKTCHLHGRRPRCRFTICS